MKSVTVFCASSIGTDEIYAMEAASLGRLLAAKQIQLIYGGARVGLMGILADAVLGAGGKVTGVLPLFLQQKEVAHTSLTELILVKSMHERKLKMHELSDGVIALPGGFGTLEELFEMLTWSQLGLHQKPIGLLNVNGFYDDLVSMIEKMAEKGFLSENNLELLLICDDMEDLLCRMENYRASGLSRLIKSETT